MLEDILKKWNGYEVSPMEAYTDIFRLGEGYLQRDGEAAGEFKSNPVGYYRCSGEEKGHFRILFEDTFEEVLQELQEADGFAILNGITYFGRRNLQQRASKMFAMIFDLDGVTDKTLNAFLSGSIVGDVYPLPNYIALSGHGVHLYYTFEEPVSLYPYTKIQLKELKYALTQRMWNKYTSTEEKPQMQGINQGFRVLGGRTKEGSPETRVRVFRMNTHPFSLDQLCNYVPVESRMDKEKLWQETKYTLAEAKRRFPEWYEKVVVRGDKSQEYWDIAGKVHGDNPYALYDWWKQKILEGATYHHRYFAIMCLAIYGAKVEKDYDDVLQDALELVPVLNAIQPNDPFTEADCLAALECYDDRYRTFPIRDIEKISGISIPRNKRNRRKQVVHLMGARAIQEINDRMNGSNWREGNGRPLGSGTAEQKVAAYRAEHPEASVSAVARALGLSRTTVYKWWNSSVLEEIPVCELAYSLKGVRERELTEDELDAMYQYINEEVDRAEK